MENPPANSLQNQCRTIFPENKWQFVHFIEASFPGGKKGFIMGVTVISPATNTIDCVIMTLEGFVLFDGTDDTELVIRRAVTPFDNIELAKGLMRDIRLVFFEPNGSAIGIGALEDGSHICRYRNRDESTTDIVTFSDHSWEIRQYDKTEHLTRTVNAQAMKKNQDSHETLFPGRLEIESHNMIGYKLSLELIKASPVSEKLNEI